MPHSMLVMLLEITPNVAGAVYGVPAAQALAAVPHLELI